ncbi:hypothetical protein HanXRQr2_Chr10g0436971 [Helianthus annuus]|uniref:Uncharacterized protein n=1 Tax=Helianthus annuus TaxID=4232 RepID=A0A9K3HXN1_HELAN|nr:hypothetical protein HanXRQr2_Chr10g0436971 [Helianthus annuus]
MVHKLKTISKFIIIKYISAYDINIKSNIYQHQIKQSISDRKETSNKEGIYASLMKMLQMQMHPLVGDDDRNSEG